MNPGTTGFETNNTFDAKLTFSDESDDGDWGGVYLETALAYGASRNTGALGTKVGSFDDDSK